MSAVKDAISAVRDALKLADDVKRAGEMLKELSRELREHDRRLTRLEAQWETAIALSGRPVQGGNLRRSQAGNDPPALPRNPSLGPGHDD
jgi:hypothetical protein